MLIEIWERLRGYDKWIQAEATILSSKLAKSGVVPSDSDRFDKLCSKSLWQIMRWHSTCTIRWADLSGTPHTARYAVGERSALFQLYDGQTVPIRYNPACPEEYYLRDLLINRTASRIKGIFWISLSALNILYLTSRLTYLLWHHFH